MVRGNFITSTTPIILRINTLFYILQEIDGRNVRVDFSMTRRPHTPTPGEYMGEKRRSGRDRDRGDRDRGDRGDRDRYRRRSRTPPPPRSHGRRSYRSRSRSWSR